MDKRNNNLEFDFTPIGQAIKQAREAKGMTREELAELLDYASRHIQANGVVVASRVVIPISLVPVRQMVA